MTSLLIKNGSIVTMNQKREIIQNGAIAVNNGIILAVGKTDKIEKEYPSETVIDATGNSLVNRYLEQSEILKDKILIFVYIKPGPDYGIIFLKKQNEGIVNFQKAENTIIESLNPLHKKKG